MSGDLPESRLGTTDKDGHRVYIHPHDVRGKWVKVRKIVYWLLIFVYLFLPWIYIDGRQIILLDLPGREFYFFGSTFYGHDGPFLIFLVLSFVFFISGLTVFLGRIWCGYACPQTVFIDAIYRPIERLVEGSGPRRDKLEKSKWTKEKVLKRGIKWFLYTVVSLHIVHSGIGYFVGTRELLHITTQNPGSNLYLFILMLTLTLIILIDFAWFREQFCIIACPYGRFQSIVMDEDSIVVAYDEARGEPRKRSKDVKKDQLGDCVSCNRCVHVCPTGIDIRDGLQMECIACTMCIDACDEIMEKVKKPKGLIRYTTARLLSEKKYKVSKRLFIYLGLFLVTISLLLNSLSMREELKAQFIRSGNLPYSYIKSQELVVNHFKIKLRYMNEEKLDFKVAISNADVSFVIPEENLSIQRENKSIDIFLKFPLRILEKGKKEIDIVFLQKEGDEVLRKEVELVGPIK